MVEQISSLKTGIKYKDTPIGKIPVDWEIVRLENISLKFYNGGTPDTTNKDYWNDKIPWITGADFENQKVSRIRRYISNRGVENSATNIVQKGNILVVTRTGVGKLAIAPVDIAISQDITGVVLDQKKTLPTYIYWHLNHSEKRLKSIVQGTSINGLLRNDLASFAVSLPPLSEQKKIAEILTSVDEAIEKTTQIIEQTKELKKGLMQKLFTRGIGHKKFKKTAIGEIPVDWEVVRLGNICDVIGGSTPSTRNKEYWNGDILFATPTDITKLNRRMIDDTKEKITDIGLSSCCSHLLPIGSVLLTSRATLGACAINSKPMATNQGFANLLCNKRAYNWFIYYKMISLRKELSRIGSGSTFKEISKRDIKSLAIALPPLNEQQKIAKILSTTDDEIEKESNHLEQLKLLKKGLMQVLLTGKLRVVV